MVAIEVEPRVEAMLDARAIRRLIQLELSEVFVPPRPGTTEAALFVRVLSADTSQLRVELWERGERFGARLVSGVRASPSVAARRVALAAAELARGLRQKRYADAAAQERKRRRAEREARLLAMRTLDGPRALRAGVEWTRVPDLFLAGPTFDAELHVWRRLRLDVGTAWTFGALSPTRTAVAALGLRAGPAYRIVLGSHTDLELALRTEAMLIAFDGVESVNGMRGERESWWARAAGGVRLERRLTRSVRLELGVLGGVALRRVPVGIDAARTLRIGGGLFGAELGVVITPAR